MKKFLVLMLAALMCIFLAACGGDKTPTQNPENNNTEVNTPETPDEPEVPAEKSFEELKAEFMSKTAEDLVKEYFADAANPTAQEFAKLYENYAFLDTKDDYEFDNDNTIVAAVKLIKDSGANTVNAANQEVISYLIGSKYDLARAYAYRQQSTNNISSDAEIYAPLLEKALSETEPKVVYAVLKGLPQSYGNNDEFWAFALPFAKSEDANLRRAVTTAFDRFDIESKDAALEAAIALMNDADDTVKGSALRYAGEIGDDRLVENYKTVLMDESLAKKFHGNALLGLTDIWYAYPTHDNTSEAAYKLTMEYYTMNTTNPDIPSWNGLTGIKMKGSQAKYDEWRASADYFDEREVVNAMLAIVADAEASKNVKSSAIDNIASWGTLEDAQAAKATVEAFPDDNKDKASLITKCDSAITKLSK
ncbi:MAG: hypothetical protein E7588_06285 [Ruminococcaceae bacterium]|nr:hypothetical protein [Oscillospiraceae bacterium]